MTDQVPQKAFWHKLAVFVLTVALIVTFGVVVAGLVWQAGKTANEFERLEAERKAEQGIVEEEEPADPAISVPLTD